MNMTESTYARAYSRAFYRSVARIAAASLLATGLVGGARGAPDGELDATFGENGRVTIHDASLGGAALQQPDGKLLVAGDAIGTSDFGLAVFRLHPDGSLDSSFGTGGRAMIDPEGPDDFATELAIQPDGKIIILSSTGLVRLHPDGTTDATFGSDGRATLGIGGTYELIRGLVVLENGQIVITAVTNVNGTADIAFARFSADGKLDTTFGTAGTTIVDASTIAARANDEPFWITRQLDGKYVACGVGDTDYWDYIGTMLAVRVNPDGSLDRGFGSNGVSLVEADSYAEACVAMPDGTIVLAGFRERDLALARLTSDGLIDPAFGNSGFSVIDLGGTESVHAMIPLDDGSLGMTGTVFTVRENEFGIPTDMFLARADPDSGLLDSGFGDRGATIIDFGHARRSAYAEGRRLIQQTDGKLVAVGTDYRYESMNSAIVLVRLDSAGTGNVGFTGFAQTSTSVAEGTELVASVRRTGGSTGELSVEYSTVSDTAISPGDFTASFGALKWTSGDMEPKSIRVPITDDGIDESNEDFSIVLSSSNGGLAASEFAVTITNGVTPPPAPSPPAAPSSGGGGGGLGMDLMLLAIALWLRRTLDNRSPPAPS